MSARNNFLKKDGNEAGLCIPGHSKRRAGNLIKAGHFFFFFCGGLGRWMRAAARVASAVMTLPTMAGSVNMDKTQGAVSMCNPQPLEVAA